MATAWSNYFVKTLRAYGSEGHINADDLRHAIANHDGSEAYHCAYDLEPRADFSNYVGLIRPALGYVWFDFDSHDGGLQAAQDTRDFIAFLDITDYFLAYSGCKGFHVGVPFSYFGLQPRADLCVILHRIATRLKATYSSLDTTIYNPQRKFRALGSKHPKTGLYKIAVILSDLDDLDSVKAMAKEIGSLQVPFPATDHGVHFRLSALMAEEPAKPPIKEAKKKKDWIAPTGKAAFEKCSFLAHVSENQSAVTEPQWYAALSIVSRFQDGAKQCHAISHKHPSYSVTETNKKIEQAERESGPRTCENVATLWDGCKSCPLFGKINSPVNIFETRFYLNGKNGLAPDYGSLLKAFIDDSEYRTIADMKTIYRFNGTHYEEYTPIEIKAFAEEHFEPKPPEKYRQEFYNKTLANKVTRRTFFTAPNLEGRINFRNGILKVDDGQELIQHSPDYGFRYVLPYNYDRTATAHYFTGWLNDVMLGDTELVSILQEFMGYVVRGGDYKYHKALWLSGSGRNGKSTFLSVLKALIGTGNYSTLSIRQIINDKFSSADLDGKIANFSEETSPEELSDSGPFKNLTGDGELLAQKKYGDPYSFRNRAKLIMTYNEIPTLKDLSPGMLSRPIIVPWKKDLTDESMQDRNLGKKLLVELPGIFNFALDGWRRLEAQEGFTKSDKSDLEMAEIISGSCSASRWFNDAVELMEGDACAEQFTLKPKQLYEVYRRSVGEFAYAEPKFYRRINVIPGVPIRRKRTEKGTEYFGMRFRPYKQY